MFKVFDMYVSDYNLFSIDVFDSARRKHLSQ